MQIQTITAHAQPLLRHILADSIDYAGLFPPANLSMEQVIRQYHGYRCGNDRWALGRLVIPANRLDEFALLAKAAEIVPNESWLISALLGPEPLADLDRIERFNDAHAVMYRVDSCEGRIIDAEVVAAVSQRCTSEIIPKGGSISFCLVAYRKLIPEIENPQ